MRTEYKPIIKIVVTINLIKLGLMKFHPDDSFLFNLLRIKTVKPTKP